MGSMVTREAAGTILTHAGPEIGVASTKAFTSQMTALLLLAVYLGQMRGKLSGDAAKNLLQEFTRIPHKIETVLQGDETGLYETLARQFFRNTDLSLPRPWHSLPHRPGRRAEAQGNFLHSRRRLSGRRDEAWPERADRRESSGGGARRSRQNRSGLRHALREEVSPTSRRCARATAS